MLTMISYSSNKMCLCFFLTRRNVLTSTRFQSPVSTPFPKCTSRLICQAASSPSYQWRHSDISVALGSRRYRIAVRFLAVRQPSFLGSYIIMFFKIMCSSNRCLYFLSLFCNLVFFSTHSRRADFGGKSQLAVRSVSLNVLCKSPVQLNQTGDFSVVVQMLIVSAMRQVKDRQTVPDTRTGAKCRSCPWHLKTPPC